MSLCCCDPSECTIQSTHVHPSLIAFLSTATTVVGYGKVYEINPMPMSCFICAMSTMITVRKMVLMVRMIEETLFDHLQLSARCKCCSELMRALFCALLVVTSYHGNFNIPAEELLAYPTTDEMAKAAAGNSDHEYFDWVICSLKSTSLDDVPTLIEPLLSDETR